MENDISRGDMIYLSPDGVTHKVAGRGALALLTAWDGMGPFWPSGSTEEDCEPDITVRIDE